jgi:hypothetical protein
MAIKLYAGDKITGLSTDTKPTNILDGATFYETDTKKIFLKVSGTWSEISSSGGIASLNGLTGATQTFTNGTNITVSSSGTAHTVGVSGIIASTLGGTGVNNANKITISASAPSSPATGDIWIQI